MKQLFKKKEYRRKNLGSGLLFSLFSFGLILFFSIVTCTNLYAAPSAYPERNITFVVPLNPGGMTDTTARIFAEFMEKYLKKPIVVMNKPGAGGTIGGKYVADAKPDGHTLGILVPGAAFPEVYSTAEGTLPYTSNDLLPINRLMAPVVSITVKGDAPWASFKDFLKYAKENPGTKVGSQGVYTGGWLLLASIGKAEGINFTMVPFKGGPEITAAILGGHVPVGTPEYSKVKPLQEAGKVKTLTVCATKRPAFASDIPTAVELGYRLVERAFLGLFGPKGIPEEILSIIDRAAQNVAEDPDFQKKCKEMNLYIDFENFSTFPKSAADEMDYMEEQLKDLGIRK